jgi:hypothetical protein
VNIIIYLNGNADAVALSDAKATGKHDLIANMMFLHGALKKLYNILRALEVARRANTNLNEQHNFYTFASTSLVKNSSTFSGVTE